METSTSTSSSTRSPLLLLAMHAADAGLAAIADRGTQGRLLGQMQL
jgi:hypothetical protein